jgi:hypothetical protein
MVDLERGLALRIEIAVALHLVKFTDNHLQNDNVSIQEARGSRGTT